MSTSLKYRWSLGHNYLSGITTGDWWRLLQENKFQVDPIYWHRAAFISVVSLLNAWSRQREDRIYADAVQNIKITHSPVFILGHWRSGTTHLHNLLAQDNDLFAYPNTYQVINPETFLTTEAINTRRFAWLLPDKRPMDNMQLSFESPQEDEFAPLLTTLLSSYLGASFPRNEKKYNRYLSFREATLAEKSMWKAGFEKFLKKLTFKYPGRSLLLKSPPHTARIRLLLELFPSAKFIHIHRDPVTVFQSFRHYHDTAIWHTYLQRPERAIIDSQIIARYQQLFDAFFADRDLIAQENFHEVSFADLERDPLATLRQIYDGLGLPNFKNAAINFSTYAESLKNYQKNEFSPMLESKKQILREAWSHLYERWGYTI